MHGDVDFTPTERDALVGSAEAWRAFSQGRVNIRIVFDLDFEDIETVKQYKDAPVIIRAESWMPLSAERGMLGYTNSQRQIVLVMDRIVNLRPVAMHEMGHAAGLAWPDWCPADRNGRADCDHSPDKDSIMSAVYRGAQEFTEADAAFCRASGYCPRARN